VVEGLVGPPTQLLERAMSMDKDKDKVVPKGMMDAASAERELRRQRSPISGSGGGRKTPMMGLM